jgi:hypothetical protein
MTTAKDVLAQHARLRKELAAARQAEHDERRDFLRHEAAARRFNDERMRLYGEKARGRLKGLEELNEAEHGWQEAKALAASAQEQQEAARHAAIAVQQEIAMLYEAHLGLFSAEAERRTQAAAEALAALEGPYTEAFTAWAEAKAAWQPLSEAITKQVILADARDGRWHDHSTSVAAGQVPNLPLPEPGFLRGIPAARPSAMRPVAAGEEEAA